MNRSFLVCAFIVITTASLTAQQSSQSDPYEGTSSPPPDDTIITATPAAPATAPLPKPSPGQPSYAQPSQPAAVQSTTAVSAAAGTADPPPRTPPWQRLKTALMTASCRSLPDPEVRPALNQRAAPTIPTAISSIPSRSLPVELGEGTTIRVRLLDRLSTAESQDRRQLPFPRRLGRFTGRSGPHSHRR